MSWTEIFRSRYVRLLESELAAVREKHAKETERVKTIHAQELERAINEANRGWAEADRLRQYLIPGLPATTRQTEQSDNTPPALDETETGTPWQRIQKRMMREQEEAARLAKVALAAQKFPTPQVAAPAVPANKEN